MEYKGKDITLHGERSAGALLKFFQSVGHIKLGPDYFGLFKPASEPTDITLTPDRQPVLDLLARGRNQMPW